RDESAIEAKGLEPFAPALERIAALRDKKGLAEVVSHLHLLGTKPLFSFSSAQDYTDATLMIARADQGGFALARPRLLLDQGGISRASGAYVRPARRREEGRG
ncbi:MAG: hypothetical protein WBE89_07500, partial [Methyloceanibacter sp.]